MSHAPELRHASVSIAFVLLCCLPLGAATVIPQDGEGSGTLAIPTNPPVPSGDEDVTASITADELSGHVKALSGDSLAGRPMGSDESLVAAQYCAQRLAAAGVKPGAADGTYFQPIELASVTFTAPPELKLTSSGGETATLQYGAGFSFQSAAAPVATGALRCVLVDAEDAIPEPDRSVALVFATSAGRAKRWLRDAGAPNGSGFGLVIVPRANGEVGEPSKPRSTPPRPVESERGTLLATVVGDWGQRAYDGELATVELVPNADIEARVDVNVVGVIAGAGAQDRPELAQEVVVLSAHRDHIGRLVPREGQPTPEDDIRNGADDDASGCAAVLEIAEALASGEAPARTVVVLLVTGEEVGFIGSTHWCKHPTTPIESVICALNFEMLGRPDELAGGAGRIWLTGDERSDLGPGLRSRGQSITADVRPEQNFFARSDNVPFAKVGIVAQTLSSYGGHRDYHQVTDEWSTLDFEHMEAAVRACAEAVLTLASDVDWKPAWKEGEPKF